MYTADLSPLFDKLVSYADGDLRAVMHAFVEASKEPEGTHQLSNLLVNIDTYIGRECRFLAKD